MKADDFRSLSLEELDAKVQDMRKQVFNMKVQLQSNQLTNANQIRDTKRDIARALTVRFELTAQESNAQPATLAEGE